jgi:hypothetical protein
MKGPIQAFIAAYPKPALAEPRPVPQQASQQPCGSGTVSQWPKRHAAAPTLGGLTIEGREKGPGRRTCKPGCHRCADSGSVEMALSASMSVSSAGSGKSRWEEAPSWLAHRSTQRNLPPKHA